MAQVAEYIKIVLSQGKEVFVWFKGEEVFSRGEHALKINPVGDGKYSRYWRTENNAAWMCRHEIDSDLEIEEISGDYTILESEEKAIERQQHFMPNFGQ